MRNRALIGFGLLLLLVLHGVLLARWSKKDERTLAWDQALHTQIAFEYQDRLEEHLGFFGFMKPVFSSYPPLYHLMLIPFLSTAKDIADAAIPLNFIHLALLAIAVYLLGRDLLGAAAGLAAAVLITSYPLVMSIARETMIDLALTTWVTWSFYFLLKSENFSRMVPSILFGLVAGLGLMVKWSLAVYLSLPFLWVLIGAVKSRNFKWLAVSLAIGLLVVTPWYAVNGLRMATKLKYLSGLIPASGVELSGMLKWLSYPIGLFEQLNLLFVLLLLPGLAVSFWKPKMTPVTLWFFGSLILFSLIRNHNVRYTLPALPAAALLSVAWLPEIRKWTYGVVAGAALLFVAFFHFGPQRVYAIPFKSAHIDLYRAQPPVPGSWRHQEIIQKIEELRGPISRPSRVLVISNAPHLHSATLNVTLKAEGIRDIAFKGVPKSRWFDFAEFILFKTGDLGPGYSKDAIQRCADLVSSRPSWFTKSYKEKAWWSLPDESEAILFQFDPVVLKTFNMGTLNMQLEEMSLPKLQMKGVTVKAAPLSKEATGRGQLAELTLGCRQLDYRGTQVENVKVKLMKPQINLPYFQETGEIQVVSLESLEPQAEIQSGPILQLAAVKAPWLNDPHLEFKGSLLEISGKAGFVPIRLTASTQVNGSLLVCRLESVKLAGLPVPLIFFRALTDQRVDLNASPQMPFRLALGSIEGQGNTLRITP